MTDCDEMLNISPYSMNQNEKRNILNKKLYELSLFHYKNCNEYAKIIDGLGLEIKEIDSYYDLPFIPVRLFKELDLKSIHDEEVYKTMTSSGTSGQQVSKIYLNKKTVSNQQKILAKIVSQFTGQTRMPMLIIDHPAVIKDRRMFTARGAGILGFSIFGTDRIYAFDQDMKIAVEAIRHFLDKYKGEAIFLFGFTFMIWEYFYKPLMQNNLKFDLSNAILIHGGGWKKMQQEKVENGVFKERLRETCGIERVHDYYGMVEQAGCIYMECEEGYLHASIFSDIITRRTKDFSPCNIGEKGVIQVVSVIPESYPGHSLLTEDEGIILGEDDCSCGRKGKYFKILGRIKNAEIRGCSDTYERK